jgi:hypothetical protein
MLIIIMIAITLFIFFITFIFYMLNFCFVKGSYVLFTVQGQCKPNAESLLYAEVQPVLAFFNAKLRRFRGI